MSTTDPKADDDQDETTTNTTARETDPASGSPSSDDLRDDVDPEAGYRGLLVTARCVGCKTVRRKLAPPEIDDRDTDDDQDDDQDVDAESSDTQKTLVAFGGSE